MSLMTLVYRHYDVTMMICQGGDLLSVDESDLPRRITFVLL